MIAAAGQLTLAPAEPPSHVRVAVGQSEQIYLEALLVAIAADPANEIVGSARDGPDALALIRQALPDVVVLEPELAGLDGHEIVRAIERDGLSTAVVMLASGAERQRPYEALGSGARAYLTRPASHEAVHAAIAAAAAGGTLIDERLHDRVIGEMRRRMHGGQPTLDPLTEAILSLLADDLVVVEVAERLEVCETTVKSRLRALYRLLDVHTPNGVVARALREQLIV